MKKSKMYSFINIAGLAFFLTIVMVSFHAIKAPCEVVESGAMGRWLND